MNKEILKYTTKYEDELLEDLRDAEEAQAYLEEALKAYDEEGIHKRYCLPCEMLLKRKVESASSLS